MMSFSLSTFASDQICKNSSKVLIRNKKHSYVLRNETLEDLYCNKGFEGKHFKIVYKKSNEAIQFDADEELVLRAANVYYHLSKARDYWANNLKSAFVQNMEQVVVRIQIENGFSRLGHFANDDYIVNSNNAWSVPAGETPRWSPEQDKWGREIWFSPMKKVEAQVLVTTNGNNPLAQQLNYLKTPVVNYVENSLIQSSLNHLAYPSYQTTTLLDNAIKHAAAVAILFGSIEVANRMDKLFMEKYHYVDTAMIPEIIYHEFSHIALSDHLSPVHSVPVLEGMADYFATRIAGTEKMYRRLNGLSTNAEKNAKSKSLYHPFLEHENNASSDFTLSLLWTSKLELEKFNSKRFKRGLPALVNTDQLIYETRKELNSESTITELTQALTTTCKKEKICDNTRIGVGILNNVFIKKGF
jgi:hypothetical protein